MLRVIFPMWRRRIIWSSTPLIIIFRWYKYHNVMKFDRLFLSCVRSPVLWSWRRWRMDRYALLLLELPLIVLLCTHLYYSSM
jgi:hypothetical protein